MGWLPRRSCERLVIAILALVAARSVRAQDDDDIERKAPPPQPLQQIILNDATFNQWAFGGSQAIPIEARLASRLALEIEEIDRVSGLSAGQKEKLRLAGQGDIKRYLARVDEKRRKYVNTSHDPGAIRDVVQEIRQLQTGLKNNQFGDGTLFAKVLAGMLNREQSDAYQKSIHERQLVQHRAKVNMIVSVLDQAVGLNENQRQRFRKLALVETRPLRSSGPYDVHVMFYQLSRIPEEKLKPIFDHDQWRVIEQRLVQARGLEPFLRQNGYLAEN